MAALGVKNPAESIPETVPFTAPSVMFRGEAKLKIGGTRLLPATSASVLENRHALPTS